MTRSSCFRLGCLKGSSASSNSNSNGASYSQPRSTSGAEAETSTTQERILNVNQQNRNINRVKVNKLWWKRNVTKNYRLVEIAPGIVTLPPSSMETLFRFLNLHGSETVPTLSFNVNSKNHSHSHKDSLFNATLQILNHTSEAVSNARKELGENFMLFDCGYQNKIPEIYRDTTSSAIRSVGNGDAGGDDNGQSRNYRPPASNTAGERFSNNNTNGTAATDANSEETHVANKVPLLFPRFESAELFGKENVQLFNHRGSQSTHVTVKSIIEQANRIILWLRLKSAENKERVVEQGKREVSGVCGTLSLENSGSDFKITKNTTTKNTCFKAIVVGSSEEHHILLLATLTLLLYMSPNESSVTHKGYMVNALIRLNEYFSSTSWSLPFTSTPSVIFNMPKDKSEKLGYMKRIASFGSNVDSEHLDDYDLVNKKITKLERYNNWEHPFSVDVALSIAEIALPQMDLQQVLLSKSRNISEPEDDNGRDRCLENIFGEGDIFDWRWMHLRTVVFSHLPRISKAKGKGKSYTCRPYLMITDGDGSNVIYSSLVLGIKEVTYAEGDPIVFDVNCRVKGDICLKVYHLPAGAAGIMLFQTHVHTATAEPTENTLISKNQQLFVDNSPMLTSNRNGEQLVMLRKRPHIEWSKRGLKYNGSSRTHAPLLRMQRSLFSRRSLQRRGERYRSGSGFGNEDVLYSAAASMNGKKNLPFDPDFEVQLVLGMPTAGGKQSSIGPLAISPILDKKDIEGVLQQSPRDGQFHVSARAKEKINHPISAIVKPLYALSRLPPIQVKCPLLACGATDYFSSYLDNSKDITGCEKMTCPKCGFATEMPKYLKNHLEAVMEDIECRNELSGSDTEDDDDDEQIFSLSDVEEVEGDAKIPEGYEGNLPFSDTAATARDVNSDEEQYLNVSIENRLEVLCDMFHRFPRDQLKRLMDESLSSCDMDDPSAIDDRINCLVADVLIPRNQFVSIERIKTPFGNAKVVEWKPDVGQGRVVAQLEWGGRITMNISELDLDLVQTETSFAAELQRDADQNNRNSITAASQLEQDELYAHSLQAETEIHPFMFPSADSRANRSVESTEDISEAGYTLEGDAGDENQSNDVGASGATRMMNNSSSTTATISESERRQRQSYIAEAQSLLERIRAMDDTSQDFDHRFEMTLNLQSLLGGHNDALSPFALHSTQRTSSVTSEAALASASARSRQMRIGWMRYRRTGASQSSINMLPLHYFIKKGRKETFSEATANKCMICQYEYVDGEGLRTLPCIHTYHAECIDPWLLRSKSCPVCQREIDQV